MGKVAGWTLLTSPLEKVQKETTGTLHKLSMVKARQSQNPDNGNKMF